MEEPGGLQSMGLLRVGHDWATSLSLFIFLHWRRKWQPTPVFLPGESQGWGSWVGCHLWGCTESDTLKRLSSSSSMLKQNHSHLYCPLYMWNLKLPSKHYRICPVSYMSFFSSFFLQSLKYVCSSRIKFSTLNILNGTSFIHSLSHSQGPLHARQFINKKNRPTCCPQKTHRLVGEASFPPKQAPRI